MILDTNILIAFLNGEEFVVRTVSDWQEAQMLIVSSISIAETLSLPRLTPTEIRVIRLFLNSFREVPFDRTLAEMAANLRRQYRISVPDAAIAATAMLNNVPLVTRDRQFQKVREIEIISL